MGTEHKSFSFLDCDISMALTMKPRPEKLLSQEQWDILCRVENEMYADQHGNTMGFTHVNSRDESAPLVIMWDTAYIGIEAMESDFGYHTQDRLNRHAARRVAQAMALINFGAEWLLK